MSEESVLVPLSALDKNGYDTSGITFGYILDTTSYDGTKLDGAAGRLAEKWRLLAGRLEYNNKVKTWCIRVPTGKLDGIKTHKFTSSFSTEPLDVPLTRVNATSVEILSHPALKYFRDKSTPTSLSTLSSQKAPIVSIHISTLANCTCVGVSFPHGVFDAIGMGQVIAGLDAELNGKPWECPSFSPENVLSQELEELQSQSPTGEEPAALKDTKRAFCALSGMNAARFLLSLGWEYSWHKVKTKGIYLGQEVVDLIVREVKAQAAHGDESANDNPVVVSSAVSMRSIFSPSNPAVSTYTHNAIMLCTMPPISTSSFFTSSIAQLATMHRSFLETVRTPAFVQSYVRWVSCPEAGGGVLPLRHIGMQSWTFSNQVIARPDAIDFGVDQVMFWHWSLPITLDHTCFLNQFEGGYILVAAARKAQWVAIEREVERLKELASRM